MKARMNQLTGCWGIFALSVSLALTANRGDAALVTSFESGLEGWFASVGVGTISSFGATHGTQAFLIDNLTSGTKQYPARTPQFNSTTANFTGVYPIFSVAGAQMAAGLNPTLEFDLTFDFSNVTSNGFIQISPLFNSNTFNGTTPSIGGFKQYGTGQLVTGNTNSPLTLGALAVTDGVTMIPSASVANQYHLSIPLGVGKAMSLAPASTFYTLAFQTNGGWGGTVDIAIDNVRINLVPEPTTISLAGLAVACGIAGAVRKRASRR